MAARFDCGVSPSYIAGFAGIPVNSAICSRVANWSLESAFVGYRYNARAAGSVSSFSKTGRLNASVLPLAVGVVMITFFPERMRSIASLWWEYNLIPF